MKETKASEAAFPTQLGHYHGMTLRDYFAAHALAGITTRAAFSAYAAAEFAYEYADAMLKARDRA